MRSHRATPTLPEVSILWISLYSQKLTLSSDGREGLEKVDRRNTEFETSFSNYRVFNKWLFKKGQCFSYWDFTKCAKPHTNRSVGRTRVSCNLPTPFRTHDKILRGGSETRNLYFESSKVIRKNINRKINALHELYQRVFLAAVKSRGDLKSNRRLSARSSPTIWRHILTI